MDEEYMCNYCSEGIIRPLQCNLNEAVLICNNIDCDFYLQETPQNCLISKPIVNSLVPLKSNSGSYDYCVPSRYGTSSLSPVASSSSSTDREVELLLKRSYSGCELPAIHSNLQLCHSFHNSVNQEFSVGLDGDRNHPSDMTHSKFLLDFYGTSQDSQNEISNSYEAARNLDEEELNEMLNDGKISKNEAPETILDEALASWLQDFDDLPHPTSYASTVQTSIEDPMHPLLESSAPVTIIPSGKSAFSEISPRKQKQIVGNNIVKSNKELLEISKLSKDLNCNMNEANFLSPVGSGISEDSGYNEDQILRETSKSMSLTPLKSKPSQNCHFTSDVSHCKLSLKLNNSTCSDSSFPSLSMSNLFTFLELESEQDCKHYQSNSQVTDKTGYTNNYKSTVPDVKKSLHIENRRIENTGKNTNTLQFSSNLLQNMTLMNEKEELGTFSNSANVVMHCSEEISKPSKEIFDIGTVLSEINSQSECEILSCKKSSISSRSQFEELKFTQDGISKLKDVTAAMNSNSDSLSILSPGYLKKENISLLLEANGETSQLSATCLPYKVPINKLNSSKNCEVQSVDQDESMKNIISINNDHSKVEKCIRNLRKPYTQGQIEIDPWSVPEIYLDELNIEVTLDDQPKNISMNKLSKSKNVCKSEDDRNTSKIYSPPKLETKNLNNVTVFRPISLRPEVINLKDFPFTTICSSKDKEPVRLSVGLLSPRKDVCASNTLNDVRNTDRNLVNSSYFGSLLSSVVFDESFLHTREENKGDDFENSASSNFLDDSDLKEKQHCVNKIINKKEVNSFGNNNKGYSEDSESELTIISIDAYDEPYIYRPQKRKLDEEFSCTDGKRKKVCHSNSEAFDEECVSTASKDGSLTDCCKRHYLKDSPSYGTITSNESNNLTQFPSRDKLSCQTEAYRAVDRMNGLCKKHICLDSHGQKLNMSPVIKEKINCLRQRLKVIDSKITLQNTSYNYRDINTQCFMMSYKFKNYGDVKKSLVQFSDISKNIFIEEEESSFFNPSSKDDSGFLGSSSQTQESSYFSESSMLVKECTTLSDNLPQSLENKDSPLSLHNARSYVNKNKCYKCCRKPMLCSIVENSRPKVNHNCETLSSVKDEELLDSKCLKVSIPKYMNSSFHKESINDSYFKEVSKRKYIDKFTSLETKPICDKITPILGPNPSEMNVLEFLKKSGWVVTECSPLINYQGPSNAITPTIIPPALQDQYGKTGSDIVLWTMTDDKVYYPKMHSSKPVSIDIKHENGKQNLIDDSQLNRPLLHLKLVTPKNNESPKTVKVPEPKLKFSNAAIKDLFLGKEKKTVKRINCLPYQNKKAISTLVESTKNNLTTLKIGSSNIFLPPMGVGKRKASILPESALDEFIELPDDNSAYEEVANDGFYYMKAPSNERSYQTYSASDDMFTKNQIFKRKLPSDFCPRISLKKERKLARTASYSENQHLQSNLQSQTQPELNQTQKMAEDTLISTIKNSDQIPLFLCVAHKDKTYVYHRKE